MQSKGINYNPSKQITKTSPNKFLITFKKLILFNKLNSQKAAPNAQSQLHSKTHISKLETFQHNESINVKHLVIELDVSIITIT